jgi:putative tryptophan/tyrosine transport system substrate-binding protein
LALRFDTAVFGRPIGLAAALLATLCGLAWLAAPADAQLANPANRVVYVGSDTADTDTRFKELAHALTRMNAGLNTEMRLEYAHVPISKLDVKKLALAKVLSSQPTVLIAPTASTALAAAQLPRTGTSVVFVSAPEPVRAGIAQSMRSPGPRITGVSTADDWHLKRLELLRSAFPKGRTLGVLSDRAWAANEDFDALIGQPAKTQGYQATLFLADKPEEAVRVLQSAKARRMDAWYIPRNFIASLAEKQIIEELRRLQVPAIHATEQEVANGALMAFAQDVPAATEMLADLTLRILRGEDAGSIPIQRPKKFILAVRPRDEPGAPQIQPSVVRRADRVY